MSKIKILIPVYNEEKSINKVLKKIEEEWIKNNFQISEDQMKEIIRLHSN